MILNPNGFPLSDRMSPVLRPGEEPVNLQLGTCDRGAALLIAKGEERTVIPLPPDDARKMAIALISITAIWEASQPRNAHGTH